MAADNQSNESSLAQTVFTVGICSWYIVISAVLINFNKFMMEHGRFPYAIALTSCHVVVTFSSCLLMYFIRPSMFPSMAKAAEMKGTLMKYFVPVSMLFILGVVCSNLAYLYCSVAFLQFMKEWNVALVFFFSCAAGSQKCDRVRFTVLMWIIIAACTAVTGDMSFSRFGFFVQACSQLGETTRIVIQEWLLQGSEVRLDPLSYQLFVGPPTIVLLVFINMMFWDAGIVPAFMVWWPYILGNALCAVMLNVTIAVLIKYSGGVTFVLSGVVKDVAIVSTSTYLAGRTLNHQQILGFTLACSGIAYWGLMKVVPNNPLISWLPALLGAAEKDEGKKAGETTPLSEGKAKV